MVGPGMPRIRLVSGVLGLTGTESGKGQDRMQGFSGNTALCSASTLPGIGTAAPSCVTPISRVGSGQVTTVRGVSAFSSSWPDLHTNFRMESGAAGELRFAETHGLTRG